MNRPLRLFYILIFSYCSLHAQELEESNLPILRITTNGIAIQQNGKTSAHFEIFFDENNEIHSTTDIAKQYDGQIGIEYRGSSSFDLFEKKSYNIETRNSDGTNNNTSILGLPAENDWVLYGPYSDKTLMRNALIYSLANEFMEYAPRVRMVELIIDNQYEGVYIFTEKIKRDKNRLNISKLEEGDNHGDNLTGGYILKFDKSDVYNPYTGIKSEYAPYANTWQESYLLFHYPKPQDITDDQKSYLLNYITELEEAFASSNYQDSIVGYHKYIDVSSFVDFFISNELAKNPDGYRLSSFLYKDRESIDNKLKAGPIWDFNLGFGNVNYCTNGDYKGFVVQNFNKVCPDDFWVIHFWWDRLMSDPTFRSAIKERWLELRRSTLSNANIITKIDSFEYLLDQAQERNFARYPIIGEYIWPNYTIENSYENEIDRLRSWILDRLHWIDNNLEVLSSFNFDQNRGPDVKLYPNPITDNSVVEYYSRITDKVTITVYNSQGQIIHNNDIRNTISGTNYYKLPELQTGGIYFCLIIINNEEFILKFSR